MAAWNTAANDLFLRALEIPVPEQRQAFLDRACGSKAELRAQVEALLAAGDNAGSFLEKPAPALEATGEPTPPGQPEPDRAFAGTNGVHGISEGPGSRIGPYKLLQEIGEGGMGTVFMAQQQEPVRRMVALKVIKPGMDSKEVLARFEAERQAIALMDHPNIAKVFDAGITGSPLSPLAGRGVGGEGSGRPYFVMELIKGQPITKYCDDQQLSTRERLELFVPVCQAIQHAHQKGVIHRDIKPSNILVANYDGRPVPKVIDFGVAKATGHNLTERTLFTAFGHIVGTLEYMSPEQAELSALDVDTRSDVYSLGVLLYELLTGTTPLSRKRLKQEVMSEALRLIREEEPPRPSTRLSTSQALPALSAQRKTEPAKLAKMMRGELDWMVMKALEKDRTRRYETANALVRDIERYLHDEPVEACPPSAGYRLRKLARRHRTATRVAGAFLMMLIVGIIASTWQAVRATQAEEAANQERDRTVQAEAETRRERDRAVRAEQKTQQALDATKKAKTETEHALKESELASEQAQAVSKYLVEAFRSPDPSINGRDIKVVEVLDQAAADLEGNFAGSPAVKGELLHALGQTYRGLGLVAKAVEMHEQARALRRTTLGPDHPDTLTSMDHLAGAYLNAGRLPEALSLCEETLKFRKAKLGPDHPDSLASMNLLALAYYDAGRTAEALTLYEETLKLRKVKLGPDHPATLTTMHNLAAAFRRAGRLNEAISLFQKTVELQKAKRGPDHPLTLSSMNGLAYAYAGAGRDAEALTLYEKTLELRKVKLGLDHPDTLVSVNNLAGAYERAKRQPEAIRLYEETLELIKAKLGSDHPNTLISMNNLANAYHRAGRLAEAIALHEETVKGSKSKLGPHHPVTLARMHSLAVDYRVAGRLTEAIPLFEETVKLRKDQLGLDNPETLNSMNSLAVAYWSAGRLTESVPLLEETLKLQQDKLGPHDRGTLHTMQNLAVNYRDAGRLDRAIPLFEETLKVRLSRLGPNHLDTLTSMKKLAGAYQEKRDFGLAEALLTERLASLTELHGADDIKTASGMVDLGENFLLQKNYARAEPLLREGLPIREQKQPDDWTTFNAKSLLGATLLGQKKFADAEPLLVQGYEGMKQRAAKMLLYDLVRLSEALDRLVQLYEATGQQDIAQKWRKELTAFKQKEKDSKK